MLLLVILIRCCSFFCIYILRDTFTYPVDCFLQIERREKDMNRPLKVKFPTIMAPLFLMLGFLMSVRYRKPNIPSETHLLMPVLLTVKIPPLLILVLLSVTIDYPTA